MSSVSTSAAAQKPSMRGSLVEADDGVDEAAGRERGEERERADERRDHERQRNDDAPHPPAREVGAGDEPRERRAERPRRRRDRGRRARACGAAGSPTSSARSDVEQTSCRGRGSCQHEVRQRRTRRARRRRRDADDEPGRRRARPVGADVTAARCGRRPTGLVASRSLEPALADQLPRALPDSPPSSERSTAGCVESSRAAGGRPPAALPRRADTRTSRRRSTPAPPCASRNSTNCSASRALVARGVEDADRGREDHRARDRRRGRSGSRSAMLGSSAFACSL